MVRGLARGSLVMCSAIISYVQSPVTQLREQRLARHTHQSLLLTGRLIHAVPYTVTSPNCATLAIETRT